MREKILVCDVDNVVVDLSDKWIGWINMHLPQGHRELCRADVLGTYDFALTVEGKLSRERVHAFWKQYTLYDDATPLPGSVSALWRLKHKYGMTIVFASHVEGLHSKSKYEFLKRHFPVDGFVATREKQYIRADIVIDDRDEVLENISACPVKVKKISPWCLKDPSVWEYSFDAWEDGVADEIIRAYHGA